MPLSTLSVARALSLLLCCVVFTTGCSSSLTTMTNARAYKPGEVQVVVDYQGTFNTNVLSSVIDAAVSVEEEFNENSDQPISEESFRTWLDAVLMAALFKPSLGPELMVRVGLPQLIGEGWDLGVRTNFSAHKLDLKTQLWASEDGQQAFSLALGYGRQSGLTNSFVEYVTLTEFKRQEFDFQLLYGMEVGDFLRVTLAPRVILSHISADQKLPSWLVDRLPQSIKDYDPNQLFQDEWLQYYGANAVIMVGYKYAFVAFDTGMFYMNFKPRVIDQERDFSGTAISLALGLSFNYEF